MWELAKNINVYKDEKTANLGLKRNIKINVLQTRGHVPMLPLLQRYKTGVLGTQGHQQVRGKLEGNLANKRRRF